MKAVLILSALLASAAIAAPADAAQVVLDGASVIGSSGNYDSRPASLIFDQQQTATVSDIGPAGNYQYWIAQEGGPANAFITVDLGAAYSLTGFDLFNTHNAGYGDRGTGDFTIVGGNSVTLSGGQYVLSGPTTVIASGTLAAVPNTDPIAGQSFTSLSSEAFRYIEFLPTSVASINPPCCSTNVYGLSELRVFGNLASAAPEPAAWSLMIAGFGLVGSTLRRRNAALRFA